jgi:hypothetical protein
VLEGTAQGGEAEQTFANAVGPRPPPLKPLGKPLDHDLRQLSVSNHDPHGAIRDGAVHVIRSAEANAEATGCGHGDGGGRGDEVA